MKLLFLNPAHEHISQAWLRRWVHSLSLLLRREGERIAERRELVVVMVTASEMRRLNRLYRGENHATDILSFEPPDDSSVGELVVCAARLQPTGVGVGIDHKRAHGGASFNGPLGYIVIHGVLHLLGFDHATSDDEAEMFALQDRLFLQLEERVGLR
jgi:probable rRNA maturation factor